MQADADLEPLFDTEQLDLLRDALGTEELAAMLVQLPISASESLGVIRTAVDAGDLDGAKKAAHVLKGFSSSFGAVRLSAIACEIELELTTISAIAERLPTLVGAVDATVAAIPRVVAGG